MTLLTGPYFSQSASGTFRHGITNRTRAGRSHLMKQPIPTGPRTQLQRASANFTAALTRVWAAYPANKPYNQIDAVKYSLSEIYHAWLKKNFLRRHDNQFPSRRPWIAASGATPTTGAPSAWPLARAILFRENRTNTIAYYQVAITWSLDPNPPISPRTATHWFQQAYLWWPYLFIDRLPSAPLYFTYVTIDLYGRPSNPTNFGPITPSP